MNKIIFSFAQMAFGQGPAPEVKPNSWTIGLIADMDESNSEDASDEKKRFSSYFKMYTLKRHKDKSYTLLDEEPTEKKIYSDVESSDNKGANFSDLAVFNGKLYTIGDSTGKIFEVTSDFKVHPAKKIMYATDKNGNQNGEMKGEWMTVKDDQLYVGAPGYSDLWATNESAPVDAFVIDDVNDDSSYIHYYLGNTAAASETTLDLVAKIRTAFGYADNSNPKSYVNIEAVAWNDELSKWFVGARKVNEDAFNNTTEDYDKGTNKIVCCDEDFNSCAAKDITNSNNIERGFSSIKFVPDSPTHIVALRTREVTLDDADSEKVTQFETFLSVVDYGEGNDQPAVLMEERAVSHTLKFEGVAFLPPAFSPDSPDTTPSPGDGNGSGSKSSVTTSLASLALILCAVISL